MAEYGYEFKLEVVQHYLESGSGYSATSHKFQVDKSAIYKMVLLYRHHGPSALIKPSYSRYTRQLKCKVI